MNFRNTGYIKIPFVVRRTTTANHKEGYLHLKVSFLLLSVSWPIGILFRGRVGERESN